jgi:hypothetical protein
VEPPEGYEFARVIEALARRYGVLPHEVLEAPAWLLAHVEMVEGGDQASQTKKGKKGLILCRRLH